mgnify:CR=1 FL=1
MFIVLLILAALIVGGVILVVVLNSGQQQESEGFSASTMYDRLIAELERDRDEFRRRLGEQLGFARKLKRRREALLENIVELEMNVSEARSAGREDDASRAEQLIDQALEKVASIDETLAEVAPVVRRLKERVSDLEERIRTARVRKARGENAGFDEAASKVDELFDRMDDV